MVFHERENRGEKRVWYRKNLEGLIIETFDDNLFDKKDPLYFCSPVGRYFCHVILPLTSKLQHCYNFDAISWVGHFALFSLSEKKMSDAHQMPGVVGRGRGMNSLGIDKAA